ncbi:MAG TPA: EAL domain-containing protein [Thermodesulfobacteriota bacterium]
MARRPPRVPLVVDVEYGPETAPLRRRTRNIGTGGLFVTTGDPLPEGTPVRLRFTLPGYPETIPVEAVVVWAEPLLGMGLRFTWLAPEHEAAIGRYVRDQTRAAASDPPAQAAHPDAEALYLVAPNDDVRARVEAALSAEGIAWSRQYPDVLAVPLEEGLLARIVATLQRLLFHAERERCKAVVMRGGARPTLRDLVGMASLETLVATVEGASLAAMLDEGRLVSHFQPIVHCDAPESVFGYEALVRGQAADGSLVSPLELYARGRAANLLFALDRQARLSAVRGAASLGLAAHLFINVNPATLGDSDAHLGATCDAITEAGLAPQQTVFEIVESDRIADVPRVLRMLEDYRAAGFRVALDDLGAGYSSLTLLAQLHPDFVKLDMALVRDIDADPYRAEIVARLLDSARALGARTVAEGVESEREWRWFRDHGADLAQGYLFARPGLPPPVPRTPA